VDSSLDRVRTLAILHQATYLWFFGLHIERMTSYSCAYELYGKKFHQKEEEQQQQQEEGGEEQRQ